MRALKQEVGENYGVLVEELVDNMTTMAHKGETQQLEEQLRWLKYRAAGPR